MFVRCLQENGLFIREQDPLKQGLKPHLIYIKVGESDNSRARSTKTRIETNRLSLFYSSSSDSRARSTKTRIETANSNGNTQGCSIREQDPLKQGLKPCYIQNRVS